MPQVFVATREFFPGTALRWTGGLYLSYFIVVTVRRLQLLGTATIARQRLRDCKQIVGLMEDGGGQCRQFVGILSCRAPLAGGNLLAGVPERKRHEHEDPVGPQVAVFWVRCIRVSQSGQPTSITSRRCIARALGFESADTFDDPAFVASVQQLLEGIKKLNESEQARQHPDRVRVKVARVLNGEGLGRFADASGNQVIRAVAAAQLLPSAGGFITSRYAAAACEHVLEAAGITPSNGCARLMMIGGNQAGRSDGE
ncbi:MAG: hypothetical protein H0V72_00350 [Bradyrhizobium sp.]|nr:hypothetical protein [Bradyrhizobium sp.]